MAQLTHVVDGFHATLCGQPLNVPTKVVNTLDKLKEQEPDICPVCFEKMTARVDAAAKRLVGKRHD